MEPNQPANSLPSAQSLQNYTDRILELDGVNRSELSDKAQTALEQTPDARSVREFQQQMEASESPEGNPVQEPRLLNLEPVPEGLTPPPPDDNSDLQPVEPYVENEADLFYEPVHPVVPIDPQPDRGIDKYDSNPNTPNEADLADSSYKPEELVDDYYAVTPNAHPEPNEPASTPVDVVDVQGPHELESNPDSPNEADLLVDYVQPIVPVDPQPEPQTDLYDSNPDSPNEADLADPNYEPSQLVTDSSTDIENIYDYPDLTKDQSDTNVDYVESIIDYSNYEDEMNVDYSTDIEEVYDYSDPVVEPNEPVVESTDSSAVSSNESSIYSADSGE